MDLDPLNQVETIEMHAEMWRDGALTSEEERSLTMNLYFRDELVMMLERAGFIDIIVQGDYTETLVTSDHDVLVFIARKPPVDE